MITMRLVYTQILVMFTLLSAVEWFNCLMYIGPTTAVLSNCIALCLIPLLVTATVECRVFAYFLLIKARYKVINTLIHNYRSNIDKFNLQPNKIHVIKPKWTLIDDTVFYINDYPQPRKFPDKSAPKKALTSSIKIHIIKLLNFLKSLFTFQNSHDYYDNKAVEMDINYNFNYIDRIMCMQTIYSKLHEIFDLISEAYGMQIIAIIAFQFITLTTLMYDFSMNIVRLLSSNISISDKDAAIDEIWSSGLWISIYMYKVYSMCYCIHITVDEIKIFLLQILHHKIKFAPFELFEINLGLFSMIFGAIITYILILIQFDIAQRD
ncbi:hypothetical protein ACKWTF_005934 [Chironomus riparius]